MNNSGKELVVGLVTPIGTNTGAIAERIRSALSIWNYSSYIVKLSSYFDNRPDTPGVEYENDRVDRLIRAGNERCENLGNRGAVAMIAVSAMSRLRIMRRQAGQSTEVIPRTVGESKSSYSDLMVPLEDRTAYILHSLKRVDEVNLLRSIYGPQFILVGCQESDEKRRLNLRSTYLSDSSLEGREKIVAELMKNDAKQEGDYGQNVNDTYTLADYFLGADESADRFARLLFGDPGVKVRPAEQAMFAAYMASGTSLSGSRKVGAALAKDSSLLAIGSNNVPYGEKTDVDRRADFSEQLKQQIVSEIVLDLKGSIPALSEVADERLVEVVSKSSVSSIIEGQRAVHAEAAVISDFARRGGAVRETELYVTTFPCHLCFKLAIDSALARVYYIFPYPKSRARQMFPDSVELLKPYEGVAPRYYDHVFVSRRLPKFSEKTHKYIEIDRSVALPWLVATKNPNDIFESEKEILELLEAAKRVNDKHEE